MRTEGRLVALLALGLALYFVALGASTIWDANEAFYVETPKQMVRSGDYVNPSFNGQPRFNKPVLSYWIVAAAYRVLGVGLPAERLTIALAAMGVIAAAFVIGRVVYAPRVGVLSALVLATSPRVVMWSRRIAIDMYLALFLALVLMFLVLALARPARRRLYLALMYVAMGLAMLTKGPVAIVLPGLAVLAYVGWTASPREIARLNLVTGALIVSAIVLPWYAAIYHQHGWEDIRQFFIGENVGRYLDTVGVQDRGWWFYAPVLLTDLFPWALFLPFAIAWPFMSRGEPRAGRSLTKLLMTWIAAFVLVFSFSRTKQDLYIFPIVPAVAVLLAAFLDDAIAHAGRARSMARAGWWAIAGALAVLAAALWEIFGAPAGANRLAGAGGLVLALGAGALGLAAVLVRRRLDLAVPALAAAMVVVNWVFVLAVLPGIERYKPVVPMTRVIESRGSPTAVVAHYRTVLPSMVYYLGRPITPVYELPPLVELAASAREMFVLMKPDEYAAFARATPVPTCVLDTRPILEAKLSALLARQPWPELWLVGVRDVCR